MTSKLSRGAGLTTAKLDALLFSDHELTNLGFRAKRIGSLCPVAFGPGVIQTGSGFPRNPTLVSVRHSPGPRPSPGRGARHFEYPDADREHRDRNWWRLNSGQNLPGQNSAHLSLYFRSRLLGCLGFRLESVCGRRGGVCAFSESVELAFRAQVECAFADGGRGQNGFDESVSG